MEDAQGPQKSWLSNRVPRRRSRAASVLLVPPRREGLSRCERRLPGVQMMSSTESGGGGMAEVINAATGACLRACVGERTAAGVLIVSMVGALRARARSVHVGRTEQKQLNEYDRLTGRGHWGDERLLFARGHCSEGGWRARGRWCSRGHDGPFLFAGGDWWLASSGINNPHQHIGPGPSCLGELDARADGVRSPRERPQSCHARVACRARCFGGDCDVNCLVASWVEGLAGWLWRGRATTTTTTTSRGRTIMSSLPSTRMYLHIS